VRDLKGVEAVGLGYQVDQRHERKGGSRMIPGFGA
jgi:hypothetical protein